MKRLTALVLAGVHTNSSLLNVISYKLGEAGSGERLELKDPEW